MARGARPRRRAGRRRRTRDGVGGQPGGSSFSARASTRRPPGAPEYPGLECSGTVDSVGEGVEGWSVGDPCTTLLAGGGYARARRRAAGQLMPVPDGVGLLETAALPEVACTVWSNVVIDARLSAGDVLLVHGGGGGASARSRGQASPRRARGHDGSPSSPAAAARRRSHRPLKRDFVDAITPGDEYGADVGQHGGGVPPRNVAILAVGAGQVIGLRGGAKATRPRS